MCVCVAHQYHNSEWKEAFSIFDKGGDGTISAAELGSVIRSLGQNPTEAEIKEMIQQRDIDGSGVIEFNEFVAMMYEREQTGQGDNDLAKAFKVTLPPNKSRVCRCSIEMVMV